MSQGSFAGVYLSVHTPRYCTLEAAFARKLAHPDFEPVRDGLVEQGRRLAAARPEVIVINSCHLITTFPVVVDGTPRHRGVLTAQEAPDLICGVEYDFPGDYALASGAIDRGRAAGEAWAWLPEYAREAEPEMGGRHLAMMLGVLAECGQRFTGEAHAYGPSSGSGNYVISLTAQ
jgi:hypothetical protein